MRNAPNGWLWALAALLLALFAWGAEQVAVMPLQTGEVYPYYSSLRADPLGTKALYESLAALPELQVSRLYRIRPELAPGTTLLALGMPPAVWSGALPEQEFKDDEHMVEKGGRLILGFLPVNSLARPPELPANENQAQAKALIKDRWDVRLVYQPPPNPNIMSELARVTAFTLDAGPEWRVLSTRTGKTTAAERSFGNGTIVLVTDTYPLSNEALREARDPALLARLLGSGHTIVFDEQHLGVGEEDGVAVLFRKYRLGGAVAVLLIAVGLFVWSSSTSFLPPRQVRDEDAVAGRDSQEGLATLLRRGIPENELLDTCFREWTRSAPSARLAQAVETEISLRHGRDPVEAYHAVQKVIAEKK